MDVGELVAMEQATPAGSTHGARLDATTAIETKVDTVDTVVDAIVAAIAGLNDVAPADVLAQVTAALGAYDPPSRTEAASDKDEVLAAVDGLSTEPGPGAKQVQIRTRKDGNPVDGVAVWVTSDVAGLYIVQGTYYSGADGRTEAFPLEPGTYYVWRQLSGIEFEENPETITVT